MIDFGELRLAFDFYIFKIAEQNIHDKGWYNGEIRMGRKLQTN